MVRKKVQISVMVLVALLMSALGCRKESQIGSPVVGHWACEQYVSCRTDSIGVGQWDTLRFEAVAGGEYEVFFNADGTGLLKLNNSPAFIKEFTCNYAYDSVSQKITVEGSAWLYALYGSLFLEENSATFDVESLNGTNLVASWTNRLSEPQPFFERFFIKRIE